LKIYSRQFNLILGDFIKKLKTFFKYHWPIFFAIALFWVFQKGFSNTVIFRTDSNYIFSSIAQGLASLIALVFVIVFFLCQITNRFSLLSEILLNAGYYLLSLFIFTIIFSLGMIKIGGNQISVNFCISLTLLALLYLFPFMNYIMKKLAGFGINARILEMIANEQVQRDKQMDYLLDDLLKFGYEEIVNQVPEETAKLLIRRLETKIKDKDILTDKKKDYLGILIKLGFLYFKKYNKKENFKIVINDTICNLIINNWRPGRSREIYNVALDSLYEALMITKKHKIEEYDIDLIAAKFLLETLFLIFSKLEREEHSLVTKNRELLESYINKILSEKIISNEAFTDAWQFVKQKFIDSSPDVIQKFVQSYRAKLQFIDS